MPLTSNIAPARHVVKGESSTPGFPIQTLESDKTVVRDQETMPPPVRLPDMHQHRLGGYPPGTNNTCTTSASLGTLNTVSQWVILCAWSVSPSSALCPGKQSSPADSIGA